MSCVETVGSFKKYYARILSAQNEKNRQIEETQYVRDDSAKCALDINQRHYLYRSSFRAYPDTGYHVTKNTRINIFVLCRPCSKENKNECFMNDNISTA